MVERSSSKPPPFNPLPRDLDRALALAATLSKQSVAGLILQHVREQAVTLPTLHGVRGVPIVYIEGAPFCDPRGMARPDHGGATTAFEKARNWLVGAGILEEEADRFRGTFYRFNQDYRSWKKPLKKDEQSDGFGFITRHPLFNTAQIAWICEPKLIPAWCDPRHRQLPVPSEVYEEYRNLPEVKGVCCHPDGPSSFPLAEGGEPSPSVEGGMDDITPSTEGNYTLDTTSREGEQGPPPSTEGKWLLDTTSQEGVDSDTPSVEGPPPSQEGVSPSQEGPPPSQEGVSPSQEGPPPSQEGETGRATIGTGAPIKKQGEYSRTGETILLLPPTPFRSDGSEDEEEKENNETGGLENLGDNKTLESQGEFGESGEDIMRRHGETPPPSQDRFAGPGKHDPETRKLALWATNECGGQYGSWVLAKSGSFPLAWLRAILEQYVHGHSDPKSINYLNKALGDWRVKGYCPLIEEGPSEAAGGVPAAATGTDGPRVNPTPRKGRTSRNWALEIRKMTPEDLGISLKPRTGTTGPSGR